jgi:peptidoglycan/LPS O-acetylase OafA/YrhL
MKALSDRFQRAPLGILFLVLAAVVFVVRGLVGPLLLDDALSLGRTVGNLVSSLLIAGVMTFVIARQRRRSGGADTMADVTTSLKTRRLPLDADPATWIPALEWRRRQFRRSMWLMPVLVVVLIAMGVAAIVLVPESPAGWIIVVAFLAVGTVSVVQARRTIPRIDDLLRQLRERDGARRPVDPTAPAPTRPDDA